MSLWFWLVVFPSLFITLIFGGEAIWEIFEEKAPWVFFVVPPALVFIGGLILQDVFGELPTLEEGFTASMFLVVAESYSVIYGSPLKKLTEKRKKEKKALHTIAVLLKELYSEINSK